jgi:hypothetical protein
MWLNFHTSAIRLCHTVHYSCSQSVYGFVQLMLLDFCLPLFLSLSRSTGLAVALPIGIHNLNAKRESSL